MDRVYLPGQTVECIKENIRMIKNRVMECSLGQTAENTKEIGTMANNMEKDFIIIKMES